MRKTLFFLFISSTLFISCYSYKVFPEEYRTIKYEAKKKLAYIINPELRPEYEIFSSSGIFDLTKDSLDTTALKIKLCPLRKNIACGQPIMASALTLGQLPVYLPDRYFYRFDQVSSGDTLSREFELRVATRFWFWDMFKFKKQFKKYAALALRGKFLKPELINN